MPLGYAVVGLSPIGRDPGFVPRLDESFGLGLGNHRGGAVKDPAKVRTFERIPGAEPIARAITFLIRVQSLRVFPTGRCILHPLLIGEQIVVLALQ